VVVSRLVVALLPMASLEFLPIADLFNESDSGVGLTHLDADVALSETTAGWIITLGSFIILVGNRRHFTNRGEQHVRKLAIVANSAGVIKVLRGALACCEEI